jgi:hypothetical protein
VGSSKRKIISEEIIESVEDMHESSAPDRAKKIARISYGINTKADNQVFIYVICFKFFNSALDVTGTGEMCSVYSTSHTIRVIKSRR